jgi:ABC-2 type transport system ATP-binding protein
MVINHGRIVWDGTVKEMKYSLLNRRVLAVRLDGPAEVRTAGARVLKQKETGMKIEVDLAVTRVETVVADLMEQTGIQDMTITSTPMEEVISHIYGATGIGETGAAGDGAGEETAEP